MCLGKLSSCVSLVCYIHKIIAREIFQLLVNKIKERHNNSYQTNHLKNHNARLFWIVVGSSLDVYFRGNLQLFVSLKGRIEIKTL